MGAVSAIGSAPFAAAGGTARDKGRATFKSTYQLLVTQASGLGADAVVGLVVSSFAAAGGLTNVFGGDAVGVVVAGTAVKVVAEGSDDTDTDVVSSRSA